MRFAGGHPERMAPTRSHGAAPRIARVANFIIPGPPKYSKQLEPGEGEARQRT